MGWGPQRYIWRGEVQLQERFHDPYLAIRTSYTRANVNFLGMHALMASFSRSLDLENVAEVNRFGIIAGYG